MQDFSSAKVGDKVWSIQLGECTVIHTNVSAHYPIQVEDNAENFEEYTTDGKYDTNDKFPSLFWANPNIIAPEKPMRVVKHTEQVTVSLYTEGSKCQEIFVFETAALAKRQRRIGWIQDIPGVLTYETLE